MNQKFFEIKYIKQERNTVNNIKLTIIAKIRETRKYVPPARAEIGLEGFDR